MKCLVLGGRGFLGKNLCQQLLSQHYDIRVFDHSIPFDHKKPSNYDFFEGDFTNEKDIENAMKGCDIIFHLISTTLPKTSNENPIYDINSNVISTIHLLNMAVKHNIKKIIFTSSGGTIYGIPKEIPIKETHPTNPICSYGISKLCIEKYLYLFHKLHNLDYTVLRISNPYGEGQKLAAMQGAVGVFIGKSLRKETVEILGTGDVVRDYIHISDVSDALIKAVTYTGKHHIFNISSHEGKSLNQILDIIEIAMGTKVQRIYKDARDMDVMVNILDNKLAELELGWIPTVSFVDGIHSTVRSLKKNAG